MGDTRRKALINAALLGGELRGGQAIISCQRARMQRHPAERRTERVADGWAPKSPTKSRDGLTSLAPVHTSGASVPEDGPTSRLQDAGRVSARPGGLLTPPLGRGFIETASLIWTNGAALTPRGHLLRQWLHWHRCSQRGKRAETAFEMKSLNSFPYFNFLTGP